MAKKGWTWQQYLDRLYHSNKANLRGTMCTKSTKKTFPTPLHHQQQWTPVDTKLWLYCRLPTRWPGVWLAGFPLTCFMHNLKVRTKNRGMKTCVFQKDLSNITKKVCTVTWDIFWWSNILQNWRNLYCERKNPIFNRITSLGGNTYHSLLCFAEIF